MSIKNIVDSRLCIGCGLCKSLYDKKIDILTSKEGFLVPKEKYKLTPFENFTLNKYCPGYNASISLKQIKKNEYLWGNILNIGISYSLNESIRIKGSSGGVISTICAYLIEHKIVDFVYHLKNKTNNIFIYHPGQSFSKKDVIASAGSKYTASPTLLEIHKVLSNTNFNKIAIVAKPCEISAIRKYSQSLKLDRKIIFISFFCAGLPSINANKKLLDGLHIDIQDVINIRYRGNGCPGLTSIKTKNQEYTMSYKDSWGKFLGKDIHYRCKICPDGIGLDSDIVCADAWEIDTNGYPIFKENDGYSLTICRTNVGTNIISDMVSKKSITWNYFDSNKLRNIQPSQFYRRTTVFVRFLAMLLFFKKIPYVRNAGIFRAMLYATPISLLRSFVGMAVRQWKN